MLKDYIVSLVSGNTRDSRVVSMVTGNSELTPHKLKVTALTPKTSDLFYSPDCGYQIPR